MLEIGTGSGYQAAILSKLSREVVTLERFRTLADRARRAAGEARLRQCRGDLATASTSRQRRPFRPHHRHRRDGGNPDAAGARLEPGGVLIAPVGPHHGTQTLVRLIRTEAGFDRKELVDVRFVPALPGIAREL